MQLGHPEAVRVHDHHRGGVGDVDPDLDDGGGDQHIGLAGGEPPHDVVLVVGLHPAVEHLDAQTGEGALGELVGDVEHGERRPLLGVVLGGGRLLPLPLLPGLLGVVADAGADDVGLVAVLHLLADALPGAAEEVGLVLGGDDMAGDGRAAGGELVEDGGLQVAEDGHRDRTGNGGGRHDQEVRRLLPLGTQRVALFHAEAVLLVDDDQAEVVELDLVLDQRVGADDDPGLARDEVEQGLPGGPPCPWNR